MNKHTEQQPCGASMKCGVREGGEIRINVGTGKGFMEHGKNEALGGRGRITCRGQASGSSPWPQWEN